MALSSTQVYIASALIMGVGFGLIYLILRGKASRRPEGAIEWVSMGLSVLAIFSAGGLMTMAFLTDAGIDIAGDQRVSGKPAPDLRFRLVESDEEAELKDYAGKVVLLNLWATWCPPCLEEMPELNRFQEAYQDQGVVVLTISDEARQHLLEFEREMPLETVSGYLPGNYDWPAPYDRVMGARPTSFVIDRQGIIRSTWPGPRDFEGFVQAVQPYL